jgi:hypothetical protein
MVGPFGIGIGGNERLSGRRKIVTLDLQKFNAIDVLRNVRFPGGSSFEVTPQLAPKNLATPCDLILNSLYADPQLTADFGVRHVLQPAEQVHLAAFYRHLRSYNFCDFFLEHAVMEFVHRI